MRFNKPAYPTVHFSEQIFVKCPNCAKKAIIINEEPKSVLESLSGEKSKLTCNNCGFQKLNSIDWYGYMQGYVGRNCGHCGSDVNYTSEPTKDTPPNILLKCDICKKEKEYPISWYRYKEDKPIDPYFGLELWLQIEIKDNILWLYNLEHLEYLKEYVEAKLREDDGRHKYSMITNLPTWVKSAKNREIILKKLDKLVKDFIEA